MDNRRSIFQALMTLLINCHIFFCIFYSKMYSLAALRPLKVIAKVSCHYDKVSTISAI